MGNEFYGLVGMRVFVLGLTKAQLLEHGSTLIANHQYPQASIMNANSMRMANLQSVKPDMLYKDTQAI